MNLDLSSFDIENVKDNSYMFSGCDNLKTIKIKKGMKNKINVNQKVEIIEI